MHTSGIDLSQSQIPLHSSQRTDIASFFCNAGGNSRVSGNEGRGGGGDGEGSGGGHSFDAGPLLAAAGKSMESLPEGKGCNLEALA